MKKTLLALSALLLFSVPAFATTTPLDFSSVPSGPLFGLTSGSFFTNGLYLVSGSGSGVAEVFNSVGQFSQEALSVSIDFGPAALGPCAMPETCYEYSAGTITITVGGNQYTGNLIPGLFSTGVADNGGFTFEGDFRIPGEPGEGFFESIIDGGNSGFGIVFGTSNIEGGTPEPPYLWLIGGVLLAGLIARKPQRLRQPVVTHGDRN